MLLLGIMANTRIKTVTPWISKEKICYSLFVAYCLHTHGFLFLLGITMVPRETGNNPYENFRGTNKQYYGIFDTG